MFSLLSCAIIDNRNHLCDVAVHGRCQVATQGLEDLRGDRAIYQDAIRLHELLERYGNRGYKPSRLNAQVILHTSSFSKMPRLTFSVFQLLPGRDAQVSIPAIFRPESLLTSRQMDI